MKPHLKLSPGSGQGEPGQASVIMASKILTPLTAGRGATARVPVGSDANHCRQPQVVVRKQGAEVTSIEVHCSCGECITIELQS